MIDFQLILWFSKTSYAVTQIKAKDLQEAKLLAYKKFRNKNIEKMEEFKQGIKYVY